MKKIFFLVGKPCAGKSTWLRKLEESRPGEFVILSVGKLMREARRKGELSANMVKQMDCGKLLPDYLVVNYLLKEIRKTEKSVIIDGFPRNFEQAKDILEISMKVDKIIHLLVDDEVSFERCSQRLLCSVCGRTYFPASVLPILPKGCEEMIPQKTGRCSCGGTLLKRKDDEEAVIRARLKIFNKETLPAIEFLQRCGIPVITIDDKDSFNQSIFKSVL